MASREVPRPLFEFRSAKTSWATLILAAFGLLITAFSFIARPVLVSGALVWGGLSIFCLYYFVRVRRIHPGRVSFYDDHVEVVEKTTSVLQYADFASVTVSELSYSNVSVTLKGVEKPLVLAGKPKSTVKVEFQPWLSQRLQGLGVPNNLWTGSPRDFFSAPFSAGIFIAFMVFMAVVLGSVLLSGSFILALSLGQTAGLGFAAVAFLIVLHRAAAKAAGRDQTASERGWSRLQAVLSDFPIRRIRLILIVLALQVAALYLVAALPFLPGEGSFFAQLMQQQEAQVVPNALSEFGLIFSNNFAVALHDLVPIYGPLVGAGTTYNTARILEALGVYYSRSPFVLNTTLFLLPHSWMELLGYAVAMSEGVYLVSLWKPFDPEHGVKITTSLIDQIALSLVLVAAILAVAAVFETAEVLVPNPFVFWVPFAVLAIPAVVIVRQWKAQTRTQVQLSVPAPRPEQPRTVKYAGATILVAFLVILIGIPLALGYGSTPFPSQRTVTSTNSTYTQTSFTSTLTETSFSSAYTQTIISSTRIGTSFSSSQALLSHKSVIVNGTMKLPARAIESRNFTVPSGSVYAIVNGTFSATGVYNSSVGIAIEDQTNFELYMNGGANVAYYYNNLVASGSVNIHLSSPGNYHLICDNTFSAGAKTVFVDLTLTYYTQS